jgi:hypothetical protein
VGPDPDVNAVCAEMMSQRRTPGSGSHDAHSIHERNSLLPVVAAVNK